MLAKRAAFGRRTVFMGNCIGGLSNEYFRKYIADDTTLLAQLVENSKQISREEFLRNCYVEVKLKKEFEYFYNKDKVVYFYRDTKKDIEYFYK